MDMVRDKVTAGTPRDVTKRRYATPQEWEWALLSLSFPLQKNKHNVHCFSVVEKMYWFSFFKASRWMGNTAVWYLVNPLFKEFNVVLKRNIIRKRSSTRPGLTIREKADKVQVKIFAQYCTCHTLHLTNRNNSISYGLQLRFLQAQISTSEI